MIANPFKQQIPIAPAGDVDPKTICYAIGSTLSTWEMTEISFAYLFNAIVRPDLNSDAIRRAYGSIIATRTRKGMIEESAKVFFKAFPSAEICSRLRELMKVYDSAASRRNEIAHGIVVAGLPPHSGWYLEANMYGTKRDVNRATPYAYTSGQIHQIAYGFTQLRDDSYELIDALKVHSNSARATLRQLY